MRKWLVKVLALTVKELIQFSRDKFLLIAIAYLFTVDIFLSANVHLELNRAKVVVSDWDRSDLSRELVYSFRPPYFILSKEVFSEEDALEMLDKGQAIVYIDIPPQFSRDFLRNGQVEVQIMIDGSNTVLGLLSSSYSAQIVSRFSQDLALKRLKMTEEKLQFFPVVIDQHRVWYNPNQKDTWFMPISEILTIVTILSLMLPAAASVREKERGTIEQLLVSPLSPIQIMLSKIVSMTLVILFGTAVSIFLVVMGIYNIPIKGSLTLFFAMTALYTVAVSGMGLFLSTLCKNIAQVALMALMLGIPIVVLSGAWTPPEAMPSWLRKAIHLSPLYYFIEMSYGILFKGVGFKVLFKQFAGLSVLGIGVFLFGMYRFRSQFE